METEKVFVRSYACHFCTTFVPIRVIFARYVSFLHVIRSHACVNFTRDSFVGMCRFYTCFVCRHVSILHVIRLYRCHFCT